jgi:hypothetical protein
MNVELHTLASRVGHNLHDSGLNTAVINGAHTFCTDDAALTLSFLARG